VEGGGDFREGMQLCTCKRRASFLREYSVYDIAIKSPSTPATADNKKMNNVSYLRYPSAILLIKILGKQDSSTS
jgi:hypothetical protein